MIDGSALSANLGVNPSLSITAQAERAAALWPNKGEADQRPPLGAPYQRLDPIAPAAPIVPADAPAALRVHLGRARGAAPPEIRVAAGFAPIRASPRRSSRSWH